MWIWRRVKRRNQVFRTISVAKFFGRCQRTRVARGQWFSFSAGQQIERICRIRLTEMEVFCVKNGWNNNKNNLNRKGHPTAAQGWCITLPMVKRISNNSEISWEAKYTPVVVRVLLSIYPLIVGLELTPRALTSRQKRGWVDSHDSKFATTEHSSV